MKKMKGTTTWTDNDRRAIYQLLDGTSQLLVLCRDLANPGCQQARVLGVCITHMLTVFNMLAAADLIKKGVLPCP